VTVEQVPMTYRRGRGDAVILIQGVGVAGCAWAPQVDVFGDEYDCITYDSIGVGNSPGGRTSESITQLVRDAIAVLDSNGVRRAHVVGHSMGGVIAQQLALDYPERVRTLALLCTFSRGREAVTPTWPLIWRGLAAVVGTHQTRSHAMARLISPAMIIRARGIEAVVSELDSAFGRPLAQPPPVALAQLKALSRHDSSARLGELRRIPSVVISGSEDPIAPPRYGRRLASAIGARFVEIRDGSHALAIQNADLVNTELRRHWREFGASQ